MVPPSYRRGPDGRATRRRANRPCLSSSAGFSAECGTIPASVSTRSTPRSASCSDGSTKERPIRRLGVTRRRLLEEIDRPALKALPAEPYILAEWRIRRVGIDYHVEVEAHYYSVPYRF